MSVPLRNNHCPVSLTCSATEVWQDPDTKKVFILTQAGEFKLHKCVSKLTKMPEIAFGSEWISERTGNTRIQGPVRLEKSALIPPADSLGSAKRRITAGEKTEWLFVRLFKTTLNWEEIEIPEHYKEEFFSTFQAYDADKDKLDEA